MNLKIIGIALAIILSLSYALYEVTLALGESRSENKALAEAVNTVSLQVDAHNKQMSELNKNVSDIRKEASRLEKTLSRIDLSQLAIENPQDLKGRMNRATDRLLSELEAL